MKLVVPTLEELRRSLRDGAAVWRSPGRSVDDDAPPPAVMVQRSLERIAAQQGTTAWFTPRLFLVEDIGAIVGSGSFKTSPDHPAGVEIGYGVAERHQRHGYATAGVRLMIAEAFAISHVTEMFATARADNLASIRVLQKCGFTPDGEGVDPNDGRILRFHLFRDSKHGV